jgi:rhodanese-related sulfurtransferase
MSQTTAVNRVQTCSAAEVKSGMERGEITLIDVREPSEFAGERIPGAKLMPLSKFDPSSLPKVRDGCKIVLHCRTGSRSAKAAQRLLEAGHEAAYQLQGGIDAWKQAGLPTERDAKAPISILRQVQITAGSLVLIGLILGFAVSPWFFLLSGFVGAGLVFAGVTDTCGMAMLLANMPWNRV